MKQLSCILLVTRNSKCRWRAHNHSCFGQSSSCLHKIGGFYRLFWFPTTVVLLPSAGAVSLPCPAAIPSDLLLLQPQLPHHLFKLLLLCFQDLVQTLKLLLQKRREDCTLPAQLGKTNSLLITPGTSNMAFIPSCVELQGVWFHHTFVQGQLEGFEVGWAFSDIQKSQSGYQAPGNLRHAPCTGQLSHIYTEGPKLPGNAGLTCMSHFQAPTHADTEKSDSLRVQQPQNFRAWRVILQKGQLSLSSPHHWGRKAQAIQLQLAQFNQPVTIFVLIKPCLESTKYHKLSFT